MNSVKNLFNQTSDRTRNFMTKLSVGMEAMPTVSKLKNQFKIAGGGIAATAASMVMVATMGVDLTGTLTALGSGIGAIVIALDGLDNITRAAGNSEENNNQSARMIMTTQKNKPMSAHEEDGSDDFNLIPAAM
jgi:hypothetical protein